MVESLTQIQQNTAEIETAFYQSRFKRTSQMHASTQQVGPLFSLEKMQLAQQRALAVMAEAAATFSVGMSEQQAAAVLLELLESAGASGHWHPPIVRFGKNTSKIYKEASDPTIVLQQDDIFFIDIGPVFDQHEADVGATYVMGQQPELLRVQQACHQVFAEVAAHWRLSGENGAALYNFAQSRANLLGMQLNHQIKGHRLGDFPHKLYANDQLGDYTGALRSGIWVLEIQLLDPTTGYGGFVEQVLF